MKKKVLAITLAVFLALSAYAQGERDSVKVYFHIRQWQFDPALDNNAESMNAFVDRVRIAADSQNLDRIIIRAWASPEGTEQLNNRLAIERCRTIAELIAERTGVSRDLIETYPGGVAWEELRRMVAERQDVPSRRRILEIIDNTPLWVFNSRGQIISSRKKELMDLRGGRSWRWMQDSIFPSLRNSLAVSLFLRAEDSDSIANLAKVATIAKEAIDSVVEGETPSHPEASPSLPIETPALPGASPSLPVEAPALPGQRHLLALKTNLLYYGLLLPNLELEWLINKHWSVAIEGNLAQWGDYAKNRSYRLTLLDAEARYWIKPRDYWHGFYVGAIAGGGWYDLQKGSPGYYGDGLMTGLSVGYMWPVTRSLSLEAELGGGYVYTRYKEYEPIEGHHVYLRTKDLNYFGPIKAKFSLVWRLFDRNKTKKKEPAL